MSSSTEQARRSVDHQRWRLLRQVEAWLEAPMVVLGFVWLSLLIVELVRGDSPLVSLLGRGIWVIFIADFLLRFSLAPRKRVYLQRNLLTLLALLLPALRTLRVLRMARILRAGRGLNLLRILTSTNRGIAALRRAMRRRGFGYVLALTLLICVAGAAGIYALEGGAPGFGSFSESLWWVAMLITSIGSEAWPHTPEGRLLCFLLALYGFAVFGYLTATLASFFIDRDAADKKSAVAGQAAIKALHAEVVRLREEVRRQGEPR